MAKPGKRLRADRETVERDQPLVLTEAIEKVLAFKKTKFNQSIELCMHLGIDAKQADQLIRGSFSMPHGIGKTNRVIAFCGSDRVEEAKAAGAIEAGSDDLAEKIQGGWLDFDVAVATPDVMRSVSKLGRVLGPRGLMPSPKAGTVTPDIADAIREYAAGKVEYRNDDGGNVHVVVGKQDFSAEQLKDNAEAFIAEINRRRPSSVKGQYVKKITLAGTMTPGVPVAM